ncbi:RNA pseudouridine synthase [Helicobacter sp. 12S02232-10]|uniref:RluA family pseudouridine synthase n=1 Tax=Helicobacter sp. 12S02232-10 TaxID=1476197 RepID=UPI000BA50941|nr:RluA family pseudouridine synthase [Helicobacter sp. 12S02232-10]PAF47709.1 RNA pseudouridine synthase [Helicobacter sp. 12S02232-10]
MKKVFRLEESYKRLDTFLSQELGISKNQVVHLIKNSLIFLNESVCKKGGQRLKIGDKLSVLEPDIAPYETPLEVEMDVRLIYEDEDILLLNKPPRIVVHSAPSVKELTLVDWLKYKGFSLSNLSGQERYGIIHRLDKETSGAILVAKNNFAHAKLSAQLKNREMGRYYLAVLQGEISKQITIECQMGRNPKNRLKMANLDGFRQKISASRYSKSQFIPLLKSKDGKFSLIAAKLYTGRTHQIRVHLESISRHIVGDKLYGCKDNLNVRMMLHAYLIYFLHPRTEQKMFFKVPVFDDMLEFLHKNFDEAGLNEATHEDHILSCFDAF